LQRAFLRVYLVLSAWLGSFSSENALVPRVAGASRIRQAAILLLELLAHELVAAIVAWQREGERGNGTHLG